MALKLARGNWAKILPEAPKAIIDAFSSDSTHLYNAGITHTKTRLAFALANVIHECNGFSVPRLTENIHYTAKAMSETWPNRFPSEDAVRQRYGTASGWQMKAFDEIYGNRMGNRAGTCDGSIYIGRGGPQITGREGYSQVGIYCGLDLIKHPDLAADPQNQPAILAAFWSWKGLNKHADVVDFEGCVKAWNGGYIGMTNRKARLEKIIPIINDLQEI
ncbi:glycoside hydrolase family 19 protein [Aureimonas ureilytica]|uniref:glycoside hydrolase family 19 protein n=1 Tax=Aureimonas ureilytica TaxID=401562 RepID=UPI000AC4FBF0|nr:glycosyl hydrolase [Aureimonas ureilytica]